MKSQSATARFGTLKAAPGGVGGKAAVTDTTYATAASKRDAAYRERFKPGTHGCHEALHMAHVLAELVYARLAEHEAIMQNPEWRTMAKKAGDTLHDLYQAIGQEHMG